MKKSIENNRMRIEMAGHRKERTEESNNKLWFASIREILKVGNSRPIKI